VTAVLHCRRFAFATPGVCLLLIAGALRLPAQQFIFSGSLRARAENWDWFEAPPAKNNYTYVGGTLRLNLGLAWKRIEWQTEGAFPVMLNLPANAVAPGSQGPLGYGADYFLANGQRNLATAALRQAFANIKSQSGRLKLRIGRFEFADGAETAPPDVDLAALKRERINQRLIGTFNYAQRSFDGLLFAWHQDRSDVSVMAARATEGSFQLRALGEINVELAYGAYTRYLPTARTRSEVRIFTLYYQDRRGLSETGNRALRLATPGAHFITEAKAGPGTVDIVVWGAGQFGRWGLQQQLAGEIAAEAGYRFPVRLQPWLRAGYFRNTGDSNPNDSRHTTFFRVLSNPRAYARMPFYVLMNAEDRFLQFKTAGRKVALRSEVHSVSLSNSRDLWYDGGGAFQASTFGYLGRPAGGNRKIAESLDLSADYTPIESTTLSFYAGVARGNAVAAFVFPAAGARPLAHLFSLELIRRF
jgi:hypothetical protein